MDITTLVIILLVVVLLGGGFYGLRPACASEPGNPASNTKLAVCTVINSRRTRLSSFIDSSFNQHQNMPVTIHGQAYRAAGVGQ